MSPVNNMVNQQKGIELCQKIHKKLLGYGYFPALTGGLLYKEGERKDIDIVIYRHRQDVAAFEMRDIEDHLIDIGFYGFNYFGFVTKAKWKGLDVDLFNPEAREDEHVYGEGE